MDLRIILGILLSVAPITELRGGLPFIVDYCLSKGISIFPFFILIVVLNMFVVFLAYGFLEYVHKYLMRVGIYVRIYSRFIEKIRKRKDLVKDKFNKRGYLALALFVAVPLPLTGAWSGTLIAWLLGLDKKKSTLAISLGVFASGLIILALSVGVLKIFY